MAFRRVLSLIIIVIGIVLIVYGVKSFSSRREEANINITGPNSSNPVGNFVVEVQKGNSRQGIWLLVGGIVLVIAAGIISVPYDRKKHHTHHH